MGNKELGVIAVGAGIVIAASYLFGKRGEKKLPTTLDVDDVAPNISDVVNKVPDTPIPDYHQVDIPDVTPLSLLPPDVVTFKGISGPPPKPLYHDPYTPEYVPPEHTPSEPPYTGEGGSGKPLYHLPYTPVSTPLEPHGIVTLRPGSPGTLNNIVSLPPEPKKITLTAKQAAKQAAKEKAEEKDSLRRMAMR